MFRVLSFFTEIKFAMKHEILYESAFSVVQCHLEKGESSNSSGL